MYLDSTGESEFIRAVFERHGPDAERSGATLVTAFGWDFVPGNLAAALALQQSGERATRVDVAYFMGSGAFPLHAMSAGTRASVVEGLIEPTHAYRGGRIVSERGARRHRTFEVDGRSRPAVTIGTSEHFAVPRLAPTVRDVDAYLGWFGALSRTMQVTSAVNEPLLRLPGVKRGLLAAGRRLVGGSSGGPPTDVRRTLGSTFVAVSYDAVARPLAEVRLRGPDGYTFSSRLLAHAATRAAREGTLATGALGPVEAFGLDGLSSLARAAGLEGVEESPQRATA